MAKQSFEPDEPLPAFTLPVIDDAQKEELLRRVEQARPRAASSVERVMAKQSFEPGEPLPAFTLPVVDDAQKEELLRRVEQARAASADPRPGPGAPPSEGVSPHPPGPRPERSGRRNLPELVSELRRNARDAGARAVVLSRRWLEAACASIDRSRSRLPARLRDPLSKVKSRVILAIMMLLSFSILVSAISIAIRGHGHPSVTAQAAMPPAPLPKEDPVPREIEQAKKQGLPAVEKLAARFPKDYRVWLELAAGSSAKADHAAAVNAIGRALDADPRASEQASASDVLALAARKRATTNPAFDLLEGPMGAAGATVLYDLSIDPEVAVPIRARAEGWIRSDAFKKVAAPDVALAGALRYASSCSARHDLLSSAAERGGRRVLDFLNIARAPAGCGRHAREDCFPCLRKDDALKNAIAAIEKRLSGK